NAVVSLVVVSLVFAALFKFLPDARVAWRDVLVGGVATALLFLVGQFALGQYLGSGALAARYGAASAILVILVWVYYSSMIVFFGAELTQVYANRYGSHVRESQDARTLEQAVREEQSEPAQEGLERRPARGSRRPQT
ncbi:MAG TPA: YhjD/YihY/BrkB family envelope integrity protein, partial [Candidatus Thermoplasmatota archaeon]|nr:YhjD/YihY/BrkB family envelope integrity protein [Candidatus Thermoplasmatota archaeon]